MLDNKLPYNKGTKEEEEKKKENDHFLSETENIHAGFFNHGVTLEAAATQVSAVKVLPRSSLLHGFSATRAQNRLANTSFSQ